MMPFGGQLNALEKHLAKLKTYDDMDMAEWLRKAENREEEFAVKLDDDKMEANRKESLMGWYRTDRFVFDKKFYC